MDQHYCNLHNTKFYRNEKVDVDGDVKVWYSHKLKDSKGFCVEKVERKDEVVHHDIPKLNREKVNDQNKIDMFACNAMNNAVSLAVNGVIPLDQIGVYYKRILEELIKTDKSK